MNSTELKAGHPPATKAAGVRHKEGKETPAPLKKNDHQRIDSSQNSFDDEEVQHQRRKSLREHELEAQIAAGQRAHQLEQNRTPVAPPKNQAREKITQPRLQNH
ncbi:hypothetical protein K493DRAFT_311239, partial [Basidiobolus meristosporus CBS 931.73]